MSKANRLKQAKATYKKGTYFLSATGRLKSPSIVVGEIRYAENYNAIVCDGFGLLYDGDTDTWAKQVNY